MEKVINLYEAKTNFSDLVDRAFRGEEITVAKAGKVRARIVPPAKKKKRRVPGGNFLGVTYIAPDFYDDLPLDMFDEPVYPQSKAPQGNTEDERKAG